MNKQKHYLIYQITNLVNGKIYIGKHETFNLEDHYFGSGKYLAKAKKKYGLENLEFKILIDLKNREEMNLLEKMVVNEDFLKRDDVYNLNEGGDGGWDYCNSNDKRVSIQNQIMDNQTRLYYCGQSMKQKIENMSEEEYSQYCQKISLSLKKYKRENPDWQVGKNNPMFQRKHTKKSRTKMSISKTGKKNNRYGSKWYYDPITFETHSFLPTEEKPYGWLPGRKIK